MLLRSSSSPILKYWLPNSPSLSGSGSSSEAESLPQLPRTRSCCLTMSSFDSDLKDPAKPRKSLRMPLSPRSAKIKERMEGNDAGSIFPSRSGLMDEDCLRRKRVPQTVEVGGGVGGGGGRGMCGGGRGSDDDSGSGSRDPWNGRESTDAYYEMMIQANPGNPLLLANYAKFLKEVKADFAKAEEYCERAILANSGDGNVLALYGDLIWQTQKDASRAEAYFDQAVKTDPNDCHVLASYARFLWDAEDEEEKEVKNEYEMKIKNSPPKLFQEGSHWPPLAAAS